MAALEGNLVFSPVCPSKKYCCNCIGAGRVRKIPWLVVSWVETEVTIERSLSSVRVPEMVEKGHLCGSLWKGVVNGMCAWFCLSTRACSVEIRKRKLLRPEKTSLFESSFLTDS